MNKKTLRVDENIVSAIDVFVRYGCDPGSCTSLLLQGKYGQAKLHAHHMIKEDEDIWQDHIDYVKYMVPSFARGNNFRNWHGFDESMTAEIELEIMAHKLAGKKSRFVELYNQWFSNKEQETI